MNQEVVAYDLDGTLVAGDTLWWFLVALHGRRRAAMAVLHARIRNVDRDAAKAFLLYRQLRDVSRECINRAAEITATKALDHVRADVIGTLRTHQSAGRRSVLVTAALEPVATRIGRALGFDEVLSTELDWDLELGTATGRLSGANCNRAEKGRRLQRHLADGGRLVCAYGNSARDDGPMLTLAERGVLVTDRWFARRRSDWHA